MRSLTSNPEGDTKSNQRLVTSSPTAAGQRVPPTETPCFTTVLIQHHPFRLFCVFRRPPQSGILSLSSRAPTQAPTPLVRLRLREARIRFADWRRPDFIPADFLSQ